MLFAARMARPFEWGSHDCAMFAFAAVQALTGADPGEPYRQQYDDARGATRILQQVGGICALADRHFGPRVPVMCAQRGDIVLVPSGDDAMREALGVCDGVHALTPVARGLATTTMSQWITAWRIG